MVNYSTFMRNYGIGSSPQDTSAYTDAAKISQLQREQRIGQQKPQQEQDVEVRPAVEPIEITPAERTPNASLEDIRIEFGSENADSNMRGVVGTTGDMRKAITDMEKDSLLHEYQYFVGNNRSQTLVDNADGVVKVVS